MEVDSTAKLTYVPYMGTKNLNIVIPPTMADSNPKSIAQALAEAKEYKNMKRKDDMNSNQESGAKAYLLSRKWIKNYEKFILFE